MTARQETTWPDGPGGALRPETHYDGRDMLCYASRPATLSEMLAGCVRDFPDRLAIAEGLRLSYRELDEIVSALAAGLKAQGVGVGGKVALFMTNRWQLLACVYACARIGAVAVPLSVRLARAELAFLLNDCGASVLVFENKLAEVLPAADTVPALQYRFCVDETAAPARPFDELLGAGHDTAPAVGTDEDVAVILYTSGTTGRPKGAMLTHLGIIHSSLSFARCFELTERDKALIAVPLSHVTGLVGVAFAAMCVGGGVALMRESFERRAFLAIASREEITFSILVPTIYSLIAMTPELDDTDLSSWRIGGFGGAPMPVATIERIAEKLPNLMLVNAYGATETTSPTTAMPLSEWRTHTNSVGKVVPGADIRVVDTQGNDVPAGETGELLIAGPMVIPGYLNRPEANAFDFVGGYWRSGDIGSVDEAGFVRIMDRSKDMINRGGFKVFSAEVEDVLCHHDSVAECAVVGTPDPVLGERVHVFIVPRDAHGIDEAALRSFCAERLSDYKRPESYTVLETPLPRNNNGKIQKHTLRDMLLARAEQA
ncbi:class I adenylate-forming enzyme family protein [Salipiger abyssi]|uniref:class I adenylate-forming enzyme family protein n=1 Tax=Salipiger abyssi TaxID=1250539 RepID=UPI001A901FA5|nr:AMP-binding protein [Salipiger abyssi]MBN9887153.1 AMP-binding protein [Salipiger abyssi]